MAVGIGWPDNLKITFDVKVTFDVEWDADGLAPIVERIATIFVHILANVLIVYGVVARQPRWFWAAFVYKTALDSVAAFAQFWGVNTLGHIWTIEAVVVLFGLVGWWGIRWVAQRYPDVPPGSPEGQTIP